MKSILKLVIVDVIYSKAELSAAKRKKNLTDPKRLNNITGFMSLLSLSVVCFFSENTIILTQNNI